MRTYKIIGTKTNTSFAENLSRLCKERGTTLYELLQLFILCIVRHEKEGETPHPELEQALSLFGHMEDWKGGYNLADPSCNMEVCEAVYFLPGEDGLKAFMLRHSNGVWKTITNPIEIFERITKILFPELYKRLRLLSIRMGCNNLAYLQRQLLKRYEEESSTEQIRDGFADLRTDFGKRLEYGARTKKVKRYSPDTMPRWAKG